MKRFIALFCIVFLSVISFLHVYATRETDLIKAILRKDVEAVRNHLENGADPNQVDNLGRAPLHYVAFATQGDKNKFINKEGHFAGNFLSAYDVIEVPLYYTIYNNCCRDKGCVCGCSMCTIYGADQCFEKKLFTLKCKEYRTDFSEANPYFIQLISYFKEDDDGRLYLNFEGYKSPANAAIAVDMARALIKSGADVNMKSANGKTPLEDAIMLGSPDDLKALFIELGTDLDHLFEEGFEEDDSEGNELSSSQIDIEGEGQETIYRFKDRTKTPLDIAILLGDVDTAELIKTKNSLVNKEDILSHVRDATFPLKEGLSHPYKEDYVRAYGGLIDLCSDQEKKELYGESWSREQAEKRVARLDSPIDVNVKESAICSVKPEYQEEQKMLIKLHQDYRKAQLPVPNLLARKQYREIHGRSASGRHTVVATAGKQKRKSPEEIMNGMVREIREDKDAKRAKLIHMENDIQEVWGELSNDVWGSDSIASDDSLSMDLY